MTIKEARKNIRQLKRENEKLRKQMREDLKPTAQLYLLPYMTMPHTDEQLKTVESFFDQAFAAVMDKSYHIGFNECMENLLLSEIEKQKNSEPAV